MLILTNFDSFAKVARFKKFIFQQRLCLILCKQKRAWNEFSRHSSDFFSFLI